MMETGTLIADKAFNAGSRVLEPPVAAWQDGSDPVEHQPIFAARLYRKLGSRSAPGCRWCATTVMTPCICSVPSGRPAVSGGAIIMPAVNTEAMKKISPRAATGAHAVLVCDGAGWHQQGGRLRAPEHHQT